MLQHLTISHYALIENLDIDWESGFSVITGETGAGKSIILGALNLLLGGRSDTKMIQNGYKKCVVEAVFNIENLDLETWFTQQDIEFDEQECLVRREVSLNGKSRAFINDTPVSITILKEFAILCIDIHSQHQNLLIQNENFLINILDLIANEKELLSTYQQEYFTLKEKEKTLIQLQSNAETCKKELDYNSYLLSEIENINISEDEEIPLEEEQRILSHAEDIKQSLLNTCNLLNTEDFSILERIKQAYNTLNSIDQHFELAKTLSTRLRSIYIDLNDIEEELSQKAESVECNPERLSYIDSRLNTIYELEQKHHVNTTRDLLAIAYELKRKIEQYSSLDDTVDELKKEIQVLKNNCNALTLQLTQSRINSSKIIIKEITNILKDLGMPNIRINIEISPRTYLDKFGADVVTFLFSANKNIPPTDVRKIASGGEIARLMLALKAIIAKRIKLPTIIFDEIDTGVSGAIAQKMAQVMKEVSKYCQVICITHLPQIASLGQHQFKVYKEDKNNATYSYIKPLTEEERISEIAHMLSGDMISDAAYNNAKELLSYKKSHLEN